MVRKKYVELFFISSVRVPFRCDSVRGVCDRLLCAVDRSNKVLDPVTGTYELRVFGKAHHQSMAVI